MSAPAAKYIAQRRAIPDDATDLASGEPYHRLVGASLQELWWSAHDS